MSGIRPALSQYTLKSDGTTADQVLSATSPIEIFAYEDSEIFKAWQSNELVTGDSNVKVAGTAVKVKMNGPKESYLDVGKYVAVEGYKTLGFKAIDRRDILYTADSVQFIKHENAVIYKKAASTVDTPNMTFCGLFNFNRGTQDVIFFKGYDDYQSKGLIISGSIVDTLGAPSLTVYITVNSTAYTFPVGIIEYAEWHSLMVPVSAQYGQLQVSLYKFQHDPANIKNFNAILPVYSNYVKTGVFEFETTANWTVLNANYAAANIRLFNTMIQPEDHEFVISQLFIRDESTLAIIDNARPRLNAPFVAINR
jgi:hypothetical protein